MFDLRKPAPVKSVEAPFPTSREVNPLPKHSSQQDSSSTIEKTKVSSETTLPFAASKPELEKPKAAPSSHYSMSHLLQLFLNCEAVGNIVMDMNSARVDQHLGDIQRVSLEESKKLDEAAAQAETVSLWGILQDVGSMLLGAVSSVLGFSIMSAGSPIIGGALIAAGVLSITNTACKHGKVWNWAAQKLAGDNKELQRQLLTYIPAAVGLTATVLGLVGSFGSWYFVELATMDRTLAIIQTMTNLFDGVNGIGKAVSASRLTSLRGELSFLQSKAEFSKMHLENSMEELKEFCEQQMGLSEVLAEVIRSRKHGIQITQQNV